MWLEKVTVGVNVNNIKEKIDEKKNRIFFYIRLQRTLYIPGVTRGLKGLFVWDKFGSQAKIPSRASILIYIRTWLCLLFTA